MMEFEPGIARMFREIPRKKVPVFLFATLLLFIGPALRAQSTPGTIQIRLDATEAPRQILHVHQAIPAKPGPLILLYAKWIPGEHMPDGPITELAGLKISAQGKPVTWRRDLTDMFAFHVDVPAGASAIEVQLDFLLTGAGAKFSSGASATSQLTVVSWNQVLLYPKGSPADALTFEASLRLPDGWQFGTALPVEKQSGATVQFKPVSLETLIDSPVLAGTHFRVIALTPGENPPHEIDIAADSEAAMAMSVADIESYKHLIAETGALFGSRHYRDYHFLLTLSDDVAHFGLEHHESSDDRVPERTLLDDSLQIANADLLPHEMTHSWNGKFRRPAGLLSPDYQLPMKGDLLWVYEGLTQYLGDILTVRSGLWSPEQFREFAAYVAGYLDHRPGREWRSLQDTNDAAQLLYAAPEPWDAWRRGVDFYDEGFLIWLDVDTTIRRETHGEKSLNDFCRLFHGGPGGKPELKPYMFDDLVAALKQVVPYDWAGFLKERLNSHGPHAPLGGIESGGWQVVYNETPNTYNAAREQTRKLVDLTYSIGLVVEADGTIRDVLPGMAAYAIGLGPEMKIEAVNGRQWSGDALRDAVRETKTGTDPIELLIANGQYYKNFSLVYHGGLLYPHLERQAGRPDLLSDIIRPLAGAKP